MVLSTFYFMRYTSILLIFISVISLFTSCSTKYTTKSSSEKFVLDSKVFRDTTYYFPAKRPNTTKIRYQPLRRFDLIFVGHNIPQKSKQLNDIENLAALIPGTYTHVLAYIGKDENGLAYAIEMNADNRQSFTIDNDKVVLGGGIHLFCLGGDYGRKSCPDSSYAYGLKSYDFMWAKRPKIDIKSHEKGLMRVIEKDYSQEHAFQIPFDFSLKTEKIKTITIVDDGHQNGSSCAEYFVTLFESVAGVCIDDVRIDAKTLQNYYMYNPIGKRAYIPIKYSFFFHHSIHLNDVFTNQGYHLKNNIPRVTKCKEKIGIVTPDLLFRSKKMRKIYPIR